MRLIILVLVLLTANSVLCSAEKPTPVPTEVQQARKALLTAREEASRAKEAWDRSKLEATLWDQRYKRAYQEWAKAKKAARPAALEKRTRAEEDLRLALEVRRLNWYRSELASLRVKTAEDRLKILEAEADLRRVEERVRAMKARKSAAPQASPSPTPAR